TIPPDSWTGYDFIRTFSQNGAGSDGMSTHLPSTSNAHPWYTQRSDASSFRPKYREAPRCGQFSCTRPTRPRVSRNATRFSPSSRTRAGGLPGSGISAVRQAGVQYRRSRFPIKVPGPTRVRISLSSALSTPGASFSGCCRSSVQAERVAEGGILRCRERPPVLAGREDLLRAEDGPEVVVADRRRFLPRGEAFRRREQDVPHAGDGFVGGAELLLSPIVNRAHRLGHHEVLAHEVLDAAERGGALDLAVDLVVVAGGVVTRDDPGAARLDGVRERRHREEARAAVAVHVGRTRDPDAVAGRVLVVHGDEQALPLVPRDAGDQRAVRDDVRGDPHVGVAVRRGPDARVAVAVPLVVDFQPRRAVVPPELPRHGVGRVARLVRAVVRDVVDPVPLVQVGDVRGVDVPFH